MKRLNQDKSVVLALKKLFISVCTETPASNEAMENITTAFYKLNNIIPDNSRDITSENQI
ncbi:MAG: hypothetical protein IH948_10655 [Bacteroidetes bacterium]|nr:hypothetical protein [Bacteroidota bacterium]